MIKSSKLHSNSRFNRLSNEFLLPVLSAAVTISLILVAMGSFNTFQISQNFQRGITQDFQVQRLSGELLHLNEVMTMSARMAATTGDLSWQERYDAYDPILRKTLTQAKALAPASYQAYAAQITQADAALTEMDRRAFAFVAQKASASAQSVLFSSAYKAQKELYASGMRQWAGALNQRNQANLSRYGTELVWAGVYSAVSFWVLAAAWVTVLFMVRRYLVLRKLAEARLTQAKHELEKSHQALQVSQAALMQKATTQSEILEELREAEGDLEDSNQALQVSKAALEQKAATLEQILGELQQTQVQMVQSEKMSSLGQLVAGIAHEINNPVNFIYANLEPIRDYVMDLLGIVASYQQQYPQPTPVLAAEIEAVDLSFVQGDLPKILNSMEAGAERIRQIVLSLRTFSRSDEDGLKPADIHKGLDSTLVILQHRLKALPDMPQVSVVRDYELLPKVECYPGPLNQVFMNLLANAIDAIDEAYVRSQTALETASGAAFEEQQTGYAKPRGTITLRTSVFVGNGGNEWVEIAIADTGIGILPENEDRVFDAFFTTKPVGKGTGIGLSISHTLVTQKHGGKIFFNSTVDKGAEFVIHLPVLQKMTPSLENKYLLQPPVSTSV